jgi:hypothetical protein
MTFFKEEFFNFPPLRTCRRETVVLGTVKIASCCPLYHTNDNKDLSLFATEAIQVPSNSRYKKLN